MSRLRGLCALLLLAGFTTPQAAPSRADGLASVGVAAARAVRWRHGPPLVVAPDPAAGAAVLARALAGGDGRHVVVRLDRPPGRAVRRRLSAAGLELGAPLGPGVAFARVRGERLHVPSLLCEPGLIGLADVDPEWKRHPELSGASPPPRCVLRPGADPTLVLWVLVQPTVSLAEASASLADDGLGVEAVLDAVHGLVVSLPASTLDSLLARDAVLWVEPPLPAWSALALAAPNDSARALAQVDDPAVAGSGLDGAGVTVMVYDGGTARSDHLDLAGRLSVHDTSGTEDHATHVSATLAGSGAASGGSFAGVAPAATLVGYGFESAGSSTLLHVDVGDFEADASQALALHDVALLNASIGTNVESNGFPCNLQGDYGVMSALVDAAVAGAWGRPLPMVWAAGNERQGTRCNVEGFGDAYSLAPPATAKNALVVGAVHSDDDSMTGFSSWGPTDDGRIKPDLCAAGCQQGDDGGVTSASAAGSAALSVQCGTSMAAPVVSGALALLLQEHRASGAGEDLLPSTLRALLVHAAADRHHPGPDVRFGYGSLRLADSLERLRTGAWREGQVVDQGAQVAFAVELPGGAAELSLTLAWDDPPGTPNVLPALVHDLDLVVIAPDGQRHFPWTLDPLDPRAPARRDAPNRLDNLEQVRVPAPLAGSWRVEVRGTSLVQGPQPFSLVASAPLVDLPRLDIGFPDGLPATLVPQTPTPLRWRVTPHGEALVGAPRLHVAPAPSGPWSTIDAQPDGGDLWQADLPALACGDVPVWYVSAEGTLSGARSHPTGAPLDLHQAGVQQSVDLASFDMQSTTGWTTQSAGVGDGAWVAGVPADDGARNDPLSDFDGSGACWLTGNGIDQDLDGGPARLLSPTLDLTHGGPGEITVHYAVWMANDDFDADRLVVEASDDGGAAWSLVESLGNTSGWSPRRFRPLDLGLDGPTLRLRFSVSDSPNDSITEAAVDALRVELASCAPATPWTDLGADLAGATGAPRLSGDGPLTLGSTNRVELAGAAPLAPLSLFVAVEARPLAFKGGLLVATPVLVTLHDVTDAAGSARWTFAWPPGVPSGAGVTAQVAVEDPGALLGVALSNGLRGTAP